MTHGRMRKTSIAACALLGVLSWWAALAQPPWWTDRNVLAPSGATNDYAPVVQGQIKHIAVAAFDELEAVLPGGAGSNLGTLVSSFQNTNNYLTANQGQVKALAAVYYDRLIEVGYTDAYPWTASVTDDAHYAPALIGHVKRLFDFDVSGWLDPDADMDGMPTEWETEYGFDPNDPADAAEDADSDGLSNLTEYTLGLHPRQADTDGDNLTDGDEWFTWHTNPLDVDTDDDRLPDGWESVYGLNPLTDPGSNLNLTAWWRFDEGSGTNLEEAARGLYPAQMRNADAGSWQTGWVHQAVNCSASGAYVVAPQTTALVTLPPFSVGAWFFMEAVTPGYYPTLIADNSYAGGYWPGFMVRGDSSANTIAFTVGTDTQAASSAQTAGLAALTGRWVHVGAAYDGLRARLYLDSDCVATSEVVNFQPRAQSLLRIGLGYAQESASAWEGRIDDVRVFERALGESDWRSLYEGLDDADADGLSNEAELDVGSNPTLSDTDGDGLSDAQEALDHGTNPLLADTDADGLPDGWEVGYGLDPLSVTGHDGATGDPDADSLVNLDEYLYGTAPNAADTDSDALPDGWEIAYAFDPVSDGGSNLVAWWKMDEGQGGTVSNAVGDAWNGQLKYMLAGNWVQGKAGGALWFDGVNDYVSVLQTANAIVTSQTVTAMAWIKPDADGNVYPTLLSDGAYRGAMMWPGFMIRYDEAYARLAGYASSYATPAYGAGVTWALEANSNRWTHVALTHDGVMARLYLDGVMVAQEYTTFEPYRAAEFKIGAGHANVGDSYWKGSIDDVRLYRQGLTSNELFAAVEWLGDADGDGLQNGTEYLLGTSPRLADTDGDGVDDNPEINQHGTDPLLADSDADGMPDNWEILWGTNPLVDDAAEDPDGDGLTHLEEYGYGTDPFDDDNDNDGLNDGAETKTWNTNPWVADTDGDGLSDYDETQVHGTDPNLEDGDADGLSDPWELDQGLDPNVGTGADGATGDPDADGLVNADELTWNTQALDADTDGDQALDGAEVHTLNTHPLNPDSDADGLLDGWEADQGLDPLSGLCSNLLGRWAFDDAAGGSASNSVAGGAAAALSGMSATNWVEGFAGSALWFNGNGSYLTVYQAAAPLVTSTPFAVMAWVRHAGGGTFPTVLADAQYGSASWPGYTLRAEPLANTLVGYAGPGTSIHYGVTQPGWFSSLTGQWAHVALQHDGTQAWLTVNGREVNRAVGNWSPGTQSHVRVGWGYVNPYESYWHGKIDDVRLYGQTFNSNQLAACVEYVGDPDGDGLINGREMIEATNPNLADTDGDTLNDYAEVEVYRTDPSSSDTDADTLPDAWELAYGLQATNAVGAHGASGDPDGDALTNAEEYAAGTDPLDADSDNDGLTDAQEVQTTSTDPLDADSDDDGLDDYEETQTHGTNPWSGDSDGDGLPDAWETAYGLDPLDDQNGHGASGDPDEDGQTNAQEYAAGTDPMGEDSDGDGLRDGEELLLHGTDPLVYDTDGDGLRDGWEVTYAFDPLSDGGSNRHLVSWWPMDEGAGVWFYNAVADGPTGRLYNAPTQGWTNGFLGGGIRLDGTNDYIGVSQAAGSLVTGAPFTVTAWVRQEAPAPKVFPTVLSDGNYLSGPRYPGFYMRYANGTDQFSAYAGSSNEVTYGISLSGWKSATTGRWTHLALAHDGDTARLFVNGVLRGQDACGFDARNASEFWIGRGHVNALDAYWFGCMDDVRVFHEAFDMNALHEVFEWIGDRDGDGLTNGEEYQWGSHPNDDDYDNDGLDDPAELTVYGTSPWLADTDGDDMPDPWEIAYGLDPLARADFDQDTDGDAVWDYWEYVYGSSPIDTDSDDDGLDDNDEIVVWMTNPVLADTDGDGLSDYDEVNTHGTDPNLADSDDDGMPDDWELAQGLAPLTHDAQSDPDGDALTNIREYGLGADPNDADSDDDGLTDGEEADVWFTEVMTPDTDYDGLLDGFEADYGFDTRSGPGTNRQLRAWWRFNEGGGTSVVDHADGAFPAQILGVVVTNHIAGRAQGDGALWLDGASDYVAVDQSAAAVVTGAPFTVAAWVRLAPPLTGPYGSLVSDGAYLSGPSYWGFYARTENAADRLAAYAGSSNEVTYGMQANGMTAVWTSGWTHVLLTHDGAEGRLYIDGILRSTDACAFLPRLREALWFGRGHVNASDSYWRGALDDIRVFETAFTSNTIAEVYEALGDPDGDRLNNAEEQTFGSHPLLADTDADGLDDAQEGRTYGTSPTASDTDGDGLPDPWEIAGGLDPLDATGVEGATGDPDGDGLTNTQEYAEGTNPLVADSDGDGLNDAQETQTYETDPWVTDTDGDGLSDYDEVITHGTNPLLTDSDGDGLPDIWEVAWGTEAMIDDAAADPDADGLTNTREYALDTDPLDDDTDDDGLEDGAEVDTRATDPLNPDSDYDGLPDGWEAQYGLDALSGMRASLRPVAWWPMDEVGNTYATNRLNPSRPAVLQYMDAASWVTGRVGYALSFDGVNDYLSVAQASGPIITGAPFTVSLLVKEDATGAQPFPTMFSDGAYAGSYWKGVVLRVEPTYRLGAAYGGDGLTVSEGAYVSRWDPLFEERWVHLAATHDGRTLRLYRDGVLADEHNGPFVASERPELWLGSGHPNFGQSFFKGELDDVRIFESALGVDDLRGLYDALLDSDGDGESNLDEYLAGQDPTTNAPGGFWSDGALDLEVVPDAWSETNTLQYLAVYRGAMSGLELHLYAVGDRLVFSLYDAEGQSHGISHDGVVSKGWIRNGVTNRVTASWRNANNSLTNAEMALLINGLDPQRSTAFNANPKRTLYNWVNGDGYLDASATRIDFPEPYAASRLTLGSFGDGAAPLLGTLVTQRIEQTAFGLIEAADLDFITDAKVAPASTDRPFSVVQMITRPGDLDEMVTTNEIDDMVRRYAENFDGAEFSIFWLGQGSWTPQSWDIMEDTMHKTIDAGNRMGLAIGLSSYIQYDDKIALRYSNRLAGAAQRLAVVDDGGVGRVCVTSITIQVNGLPMGWKADFGSRAQISNFVAAWKQDLSLFSNYTYFIFNEDMLSSPVQPYTASPTYSEDALAWFREYTTNRYGSAYADIRFPVSARNVDESTWGLYTNLQIDAAWTGRLVMTGDPGHWAKWWEWRCHAFTYLLHAQTRALHELNGSNAWWRGAVYFTSPIAPWDDRSAVDLALLDRLPYLQYLVMENHRLNSYGVTSSQQEEEVRLQLAGLKSVTTNGSGLGGYAMAHAYPYPTVEGGVTSFTCSVTWMTQDIAQVIADDFDADLVMPYSADVLVYRPGHTGYQGAVYVEDAADEWNRWRFGRMWTHPDTLAPDPAWVTNMTQTLTWSPVEQAAYYEWVCSTTATFATTNLVKTVTTNEALYSLLLDPFIPDTDYAWRVRSWHRTQTFDPAGALLDEFFYPAPWSEGAAPILRVEDTDADGLPDAWERHFFGDLDEEALDDPDGDGRTNIMEYYSTTNPTLS